MSLFNNILYKKIIKHVNRIRFKWRYRFFLNKKTLSKSQNLLLRRAESELDIITIAFNNAKMIEFQILLIKKYLKDSHTHIIADNSNDQIQSENIRKVCQQYGVLYVSIPYIALKPSWSHAAGIHWVYKNVIKARSSSYFGFLDHDIFPTKSTTIIDKLWNGIYGRPIPAYCSNEISVKQPFWSLWGGFFFFNSEIFKNVNVHKIDFFPKNMPNGLILDTGGGLWEHILSKLPLPPPLLTYNQVTIGDKFRDIQSDAYEVLGDWVHMVNLSNWYGSESIDQKISYMETYLNNLINS